MDDVARESDKSATGRVAVWLTGVSSAAYFAFSDSVKIYIDVLVSNVAKTLGILSQ